MRRLFHWSLLLGCLTLAVWGAVGVVQYRDPDVLSPAPNGQWKVLEDRTPDSERENVQLLCICGRYPGDRGQASILAELLLVPSAG